MPPATRLVIGMTESTLCSTIEMHGHLHSMPHVLKRSRALRDAPAFELRFAPPESGSSEPSQS